MNLSCLPAPESEHSRRTGASFTVRSANSPTYSLTRRPGVRKPRGSSEEETKGAKEVGERERNATEVPRYQARSGTYSSVRNQHEQKEILGHEMLPKLNQNGKMITEPGTNTGENHTSERGRTEWRRHNMSTRSKSLDWRTEARSPVRGTREDVLSTKGSDEIKQAGGSDDRRPGAEAVRGRVMSSVLAYNTAGRTNIAPERSPVNETLSRVNRGHSLPSRLRSQCGPGPSLTETATAFGPTGGQSILERIEMLYGSAGFGKAGGTFPRRLSSDEKSSFSQMQSIKSVNWTPPKLTSGSEGSFSLERSRRLSGGQWQGQGQVQVRYPEQSGGDWGKGLVDIGTRSLDRARSRDTVAAQIRRTRAAGGISAPPDSNYLLKEDTLRESSGFRANGCKDQGGANHVKEKSDTSEVKEAKETDCTKDKSEMKSGSTDDVFEANPNKMTLKTIEKKNFPAASSTDSVRNKINQFEALSQRAQGLVTGLLTPRRAFSVPTPPSKDCDGVKKSGSAKAIGGQRDKWEVFREGGEVQDKSVEKVTGAGKMRLLERRVVSVDEVGPRWKESEENGLVSNERKEVDTGSSRTIDFGKYSRLKNTLEIPLNRGAQRRSRNFYIDETDFSKVSSPEEANANNTLCLPQSNPRDASATVQKTLSVMTSPVSDDDKTPTNTPSHSPFISPTAPPENLFPAADRHDGASDITQAAKDPDSPSPPRPVTTSFHSKLPDLICPDGNAANQKGKKQALDLDAWFAGLNSEIKVWKDDKDYEDDDESTQKDDESNYDSDSGESSVTITSNMSQSDHRSFCVSLSDLCNFAGVDYESDNDSDEWQSMGRRSASLSSDISALSYVSVMPSEELDRLLEDVRNLGDNTIQDYEDVQVVVLHKEVGVGLGFSVAGGVDQNKPVTVHRVFHSGVAAQEGSIREGDQVLSINGTALCGYAHWEVLRVLRRAKTREMGVVVLRRGDVSSVSKSKEQTSIQRPTKTEFTEAGQDMFVRLEKKSRDLGFCLEGGVDSSLGNKPLTVQKIFQGGPVDKVCPGDEILQIGGVSMVGMRRLEAWTLIRKLPPGPVDVVLHRPVKHLKT